MIKKLICLILLFLIFINGFNQSHPLNDALYRDIVMYNMGISNNQVNSIIIIDNFLTTLQLNKSQDYSLESFSNFDLPSKDPKHLIREYKLKKAEIDITCNTLRLEMDARLDNELRDIIFLAEKELNKHGVKTTTGNDMMDAFLKESVKNISKDFIIRQKEKKIQAAKRVAEQQLRYELQNKLEPIKNSMLGENLGAMEQYLYAMAYGISVEEERNYTNYYNFHKCLYSTIKRKYSIYSTDWLNPDCEEPNYVPSGSQVDYDFLKVARRKLGLYDLYNDPVFKKTALEFIDMAVHANPDNPAVFILKSDMEKDLINKNFYINIAYKLNPNYPQLSIKKRNLERDFRREFIRSIDNNNMDFLRRAMSKGLHQGILINDNAPVFYAIEKDKERSMKLFINTNYSSNTNPTFLNKLLVQALLANSVDCFNGLLQMGADHNYISLRKYPILYIALTNDNKRITKNLLNRSDLELEPVFNACIDDLEKIKLCEWIQDYSPNAKTRINQYYSDYYKYAFLDFDIQPSSAKLKINGQIIKNDVLVKLPFPANLKFSLDAKGKLSEQFDYGFNSPGCYKLHSRMCDQLVVPKPIPTFSERLWNYYFVEPSNKLDKQLWIDAKMIAQNKAQKYNENDLVYSRNDAIKQSKLNRSLISRNKQKINNRLLKMETGNRKKNIHAEFDDYIWEHIEITKEGALNSEPIKIELLFTSPYAYKKRKNSVAYILNVNGSIMRFDKKDKVYRYTYYCQKPGKQYISYQIEIEKIVSGIPQRIVYEGTLIISPETDNYIVYSIGLNSEDLNKGVHIYEWSDDKTSKYIFKSIDQYEYGVKDFRSSQISVNPKKRMTMNNAMNP